MSNSLRPHGLQPAGLFCPWDFPGKNTGVGCHFLSPGESSGPRDRIGVSCWAGRFFTTEPLGNPSPYTIHLQIPHPLCCSRPNNGTPKLLVLGPYKEKECVMKLGILRWEDYPGLSRWVLNSITCNCPHRQKQRERDALTEGEAM